MTGRLWKTVTGSSPCPICGKGDWCRTSGEIACCKRASDLAPPGWRRIKPLKHGGAVFGPDNVKTTKSRRRTKPAQRDRNEEAARYVAAVREDEFAEFARSLGVSVDSLRSIRCGRSEALSAWMFPEVDGRGEVVGFLRRTNDHKKRSGRGDKRGLCVPTTLTDLADPILIVEGPTDVAACLTMGLSAVGRPSNASGGSMLAELLGQRSVIVIGENDQKEDGAWPGRDGAVSIAQSLATAWKTPILWSMPPDSAKDVRNYLIATDGDPHAAGQRLLEHLQTTAQTVDTADVPVEFEIERRANRVKATVTASRGGDVLAVDTFDPNSGSGRKKFIKEISGKSGIDAEQLEADLLRRITIRSDAPPPAKADLHDRDQLLAEFDELVAERLESTDPKTVSEARALLRDPRLIPKILSDIAAMGIVGEQLLALTIYLIGTSRLLIQPISGVIQGTTASGKSYIIEQIAKQFPPESLLVATDLTANSLYYLPPGRLIHRWVVGGERPRREDDEHAEATRALREMISSGVLRKVVTITANGHPQTIEIQQDGPIAFTESTTRPEIFAEDANRALLLSTDESAEQTRSILRATAHRAMHAALPVDHIVDRQCTLQRLLKRCRVVVPFADRLSEAMPTDRPEARRAIGHVISAISVVALLHQYQRLKHEPEHGETITALIDDYVVALSLLDGPLGRALGNGLPGAVTRLGQRLWSHFGDAPFTTTEARNLKGVLKSKGHLLDHLRSLESAGFVTHLESGTGRKADVWSMRSDVSDACARWLPAAHELDPSLRSRVVVPEMPTVSHALVPEGA